ncbi:MAG: hypothetical protein KAS29_14935, partial [Bacteroidales bacterium]|nr:hypothetical protein [Bacteroidales bacterium]
MEKQLIFLATLLVTLLAFGYTTRRYVGFFKITRGGFPVKQIGRRIGVMLEVAIGQTKIFRRPILGLLHALVFWGFLVILIGSIEMVIDGLTGTERVLSFLGVVYNIIIASGDIFALVIALAIIIFLARRIFLNVKRFSGIEMKHISHLDANVALTIILVLMLSLLGMNTYYVLVTQQAGHGLEGVYPVSQLLASRIDAGAHTSELLYQVNWWI